MASIKPTRVTTGLLHPNHHLLWLDGSHPIPVTYRTTPMTLFLNVMPLLQLPWLWTYCDTQLGRASALATLYLASAFIGNTFKPSPFFLVDSDGLVSLASLSLLVAFRGSVSTDSK